MEELTLLAIPENLQRVLDFVAAQLEEKMIPSKVQLQIQIAVEEIFVNISNYAYQSKAGLATIRVELTNNPLQIILTFVDSGIPYDPLKKEDPDVALPLCDREIGGLGIFMVKKSMDNIRYEYKDGKNILTVKKIMSK